MKLTGKQNDKDRFTYTYAQEEISDIWQLNKSEIEDENHLAEKGFPVIEVKCNDKKAKLRTSVVSSAFEIKVYLNLPSSGKLILKY